jgi:hypothetical protein
MNTFLIGVGLIVLLGAGGGFYGHKRAGWQGVAGVLALAALALVFLWLLHKTDGI